MEGYLEVREMSSESRGHNDNDRRHNVRDEQEKNKHDRGREGILEMVKVDIRRRGQSGEFAAYSEQKYETVSRSKNAHSLRPRSTVRIGDIVLSDLHEAETNGFKDCIPLPEKITANLEHVSSSSRRRDYEDKLEENETRKSGEFITVDSGSKHPRVTVNLLNETGKYKSTEYRGNEPLSTSKFFILRFANDLLNVTLESLMQTEQSREVAQSNKLRKQRAYLTKLRKKEAKNKRTINEMTDTIAQQAIELSRLKLLSEGHLSKDTKASRTESRRWM